MRSLIDPPLASNVYLAERSPTRGIIPVFRVSRPSLVKVWTGYGF